MSSLSRARRAFRDAALSELRQMGEELPEPARTLSRLLDVDASPRSGSDNGGRNQNPLPSDRSGPPLDVAGAVRSRA
jgi:hypothetical protein